jgi:predicted transcriptional regulator
MRLDAYLLQNDIEFSDFAKAIGVHRTSVYRFVKGLAFPRPSTIERIIQVTGGNVTANDFLGLSPHKLGFSPHRKLAAAG